MRCICITILVIFFCSLSSLVTADLTLAAEKTLNTIKWVEIPAGEFLMGSTPKEAETAFNDAKLRSSLLEKHAFDAEVPQHTVHLSAYQISRYEITNAQYRAFIEATNRPVPRGNNGEETLKDNNYNADTQPVVGVTWFDAQAFAEWIGASLPTEAQWERAARGTEGRKYPWGNDPPKVRQHANFARRYNKPTPVGQFQEGDSPNGIVDLAGNVWEWCLDEYDSSFYQRNGKDVKQDPLNLRFRDILRARVIRGGAWDTGSTFLRSALRSMFYPLDSTHNIGFRVVRPRPQIKKQY